MSAIERPWARAALSMVAALVLALTAVAASAPSAPSTSAAGPTSSFGYESDVGDPLAAGRSGLVTSVDHSFYSTPNNGLTAVYIEDASGSLRWMVAAIGPDGTPLVAGTTYDVAGYGTSPGAPWVQVLSWGFGSSCSGIDGSFTVHDVSYDGDIFERLSMSIAITCRSVNEGGSFAGELRFNTSSPAFNAASLSPDPPRHEFPDRLLGEASPKKTWTIANLGEGSLTVGSGALNGDDPTEFEILDDTCSNTSLASGDTCTFATRFTPTRRGDMEAYASMPIDTALGHREVRLRGAAIEPTSTSLEVPTGWVWGQVEFKATVSPNPVRSNGDPWVSFRWPDDPQLIAFPSLDQDGVAMTWQTHSPGPHRVYAEFPGYENYASSRSETLVVNVGESTSITLTSDMDPAIAPARPILTATLHSTPTPFAGGELVIEDVSEGVVLGTLAVTAGQQELQVQPSLAVGPHLIRATYSGHDLHGPSTAELTQDMLLDATASVSPITFYPVVDKYRDDLSVSGTRNVDASVHVLIESFGTGEPAFDHTSAVGSGDYLIKWNGLLDSTAELAPAGQYDVTVTLDHGGAHPKVVEKRVTLSHDWVSWRKKSVVKSGKQISLWGWTKDARVSFSKSSYANGVRLISNRGFATVIYTFPVAKSKIYGWMSFDVQGKSPNKHKAMLSIWNPQLGTHKDLANYDVARKVGPRFKWWKNGTLGQGRKKDGKVRAAVMVWKGLGGSGKSVFDVKRARLTYKVGTLHSAAETGVTGSALEQELLAAAPQGAVGTRVSSVAPNGLPKLRAAIDQPTFAAPAATATSSFYYESDMDDGIGRGRSGYGQTGDVGFESPGIVIPQTPYNERISLLLDVPSGTRLVAGQTYTGGVNRLEERGVRHSLCRDPVESAHLVNDVAYDADGKATTLSITSTVRCAGTGVFRSEYRYNTTTPAYNGAVLEPNLYDDAQLPSAVIGGHADKSYVLRAVGSKPLQIGAATFDALDPTQWSLVNDDCTGRTLDPGTTCTFDVRFKPTARGRRSARVSIALDSAAGHRTFDVVSRGQLPTTTTMQMPKGPFRRQATIAAQVTPKPDDGTSICMKYHFTGPSTKVGTNGCDADGKSTYSADPGLGSWAIKAVSVGTPDFASSSSDTFVVRWVEEMRDWGTAYTKPSTFYPVRDGYLDTVAAHGNRKFPLKVAIAVTQVTSGEVVAEASIPKGTGKYRWEWDGTIDGQSGIAPYGLYDVAVTLSDDDWNEKTFTKQIKLSRKWVKWTKKSVTLPGQAYGQFGTSANATISRARSNYALGVRLGSGKGAAVVEYAFPVSKSRIYGWVSVSVQGKSPNGHKALLAIWNPKLGTYRDLSNFDSAISIGPGYKWWKTGTNGLTRVRNGKVRAAVMTWKGLGKSGPAAFDIRKVKLTYKVGKLMSPSAASLDESTDLAIAANEAEWSIGQRVVRIAERGVLPLLRDVSRPPDLSRYESVDEVEPESTEEPSQQPEQTQAPESTSEPTTEPEPTEEPPLAEDPPPTDEPEPTDEPKATDEPTPTDDPPPAAEPKATRGPVPASRPTQEPEPESAEESALEPKPEPPPANLRPIADAGGPYIVDEGTELKLDGSASTDPDGRLVLFEWSRAKRLDDATKRRPVFVALDDGHQKIKLTVTDDAGARNAATARIRVDNVAPSVARIDELSVETGVVLELPVVIRDPGVKDVHELFIDWADGSSGPDRSHSYADPGTYQVTIIASDDDGGVGRTHLVVVVTEPEITAPG